MVPRRKKQQIPFIRGLIGVGVLCAIILASTLGGWSKTPRTTPTVNPSAVENAGTSPVDATVSPWRTTPPFQASPSLKDGDDDDTKCKDIGDQPDKCTFVRENCDDAAGIINYLEIRYCYNGGTAAWAAFVIIFMLLWLILLMSLLGSTADVFFVPALELLSEELNLSPTVAGMTFLALGNGAPDIFTALAAGQADDIPLVMGELFGANVCITCFVLGSVILAADVKIPSRVFWRDYISYTVGVLIAIIICAIRPIHFWQPMLLLAIYIVYVTGTVSYIQYQRCKAQAQDQLDREKEEAEAKASTFDRIAQVEAAAQNENKASIPEAHPHPQIADVCHDACLEPCMLTECEKSSCARACTLENCPLQKAAEEAAAAALAAMAAATVAKVVEAEQPVEKPVEECAVEAIVKANEKSSKSKKKQNRKGNAATTIQSVETVDNASTDVKETENKADADESKVITDTPSPLTGSVSTKTTEITTVVPVHHHHHHHDTHHHFKSHVHSRATRPDQLVVHCCGLPHHRQKVVPEADLFGIEAELAEHDHEHGRDHRKRATSALAYSASVNNFGTSQDTVVEIDSSNHVLLRDQASDAEPLNEPEDDEVEVDHSVYLEGLSYPNPEWENKTKLLRTLNQIQYVVELPFSLLRWLTVPSPHIRPDRWGRVKTVFGLLSPTFISLLILVNAKGFDGYSERIGHIPLGVFCFFMGLTGSLLMSLWYFCSVRIDHTAHHSQLREREARTLHVDEGAQSLLANQASVDDVVPVNAKEPLMMATQSNSDDTASIASSSNQEIDTRPPSVARFQVVVSLLAFLGAVAWLNLIANEVVAVLQSFGIMFNISTAILGSTVLAIGNSIPDWISNTAMARAGHSQTALASVFGAPLMTTYVGLCIALASSTLPIYPAAFHYDFNFHVWIPWIFIGIACVVNGISFPYFKYHMPSKIGLVSIAIYVAFLIVTVVTEVHGTKK